MKRNLPTTILAAAMALLLQADSANALVIGAGDPLNIPGLSAGSSFQLVFVTSTKTDRDSLDGADDGVDNTVVAHWNNYVNSIADTSSIAGFGDLNWSAIVSVANPTAGNVNAKDNALVSAPVYLTDGSQFATGFADMWDGSAIPFAILYDEDGTLINTAGGSGAGRLVWTGSTSAGLVQTTYPIGDGTTGDASASTGTTGFSATPTLSSAWIQQGVHERRGVDTVLRVYGLSEVITIQSAVTVPEPATASLALLAAGGLFMRRRRMA